MKRKIKRIVLPLFAVIFLCSMNRIAFAAEDFPDLERNGSISVTMKDAETEKIVSGGSLQLYRVAEAAEQDGDYRFSYTEAFSGCGLSLEDVQSEKLAFDLAVYAEKNVTADAVQSVSSDGTVSFQEVKTGLYLIVQQTTAGTEYMVEPFLVSVPMQPEDGAGWIYDVDASPKAELKRIGSSNPTPEEPPQSETPSGGKGTKLPQTGQLNWPIPVMSIAGVILFALGWKLNEKKQK